MLVHMFCDTHTNAHNYNPHDKDRVDEEKCWSFGAVASHSNSLDLNRKIEISEELDETFQRIFDEAQVDHGKHIA